MSRPIVRSAPMIPAGPQPRVCRTRDGRRYLWWDFLGIQEPWHWWSPRSWRASIRTLRFTRRYW